MPRRNFLLILAYDGSGFEGWQRGPALPAAEGRHPRTVQATVETALSELLGETIEIVGAGRTDAGVHAEGQAASFHSRSTLGPEAIVAGLSPLLPPDIRCVSCREVDPRFHARYRAKGKLYRYRLHVAALSDPLLRPTSLHVGPGLDLGAMRGAAALLEGNHDFGAFTNAKGKGDTVRSIESVRVEAAGDIVDLFFRGEGFLYNQVRIMAAAILEAGRGRLALDDIAAALAGGSRRAMPGALGAFGLCLVAIYY
jgi:tRNA pseudouridine38-40 synthase